MIHVILPVGPLQCNCSILGDERTHEAMVVDPGDNVDDIAAVLEQHHLRVTAIVITHAHIDHVAGAAELKRRTGAPVYMNPADAELLAALDMQAAWLGVATPEGVVVDTPASEALSLKVGPAEFHVMQTPGHTQGSVSLYSPDQSLLLAGDTLFRDSIGRTDLPGGDMRAILRSIKTRLLTLPEETVVIPGHGQPTTIGREKERNPFLQGL